MWNDFPDLEKELKQTRQLIFSKIFIRNQQVNAAAKGIFKSNGKDDSSSLFAYYFRRWVLKVYQSERELWQQL